MTSGSKILSFDPGQLILRPDEIPRRLFLVFQGSVRLLAKRPDNREAITLCRRGPGQLLGWVSLLRGSPCEWVTASESSMVITLSSEAFIEAYKKNQEFAISFQKLNHPQEAYAVLSASVQDKTVCDKNWAESLLKLSQNSATLTFPHDQVFEPNDHNAASDWLISTDGFTGVPVGSLLTAGSQLPDRPGYQLDVRCVRTLQENKQQYNQAIDKFKNLAEEAQDLPGMSLRELGILEDDFLEDEQRFPVVCGRGPIKEALAVCEMIALHQSAPFRKDIIEKILEDQFRRNKSLSLELVARLCELLGLNCQIAAVDSEFINSVELPAILMIESVPVVIYALKKSSVIIAHPHRGICRYSYKEFKSYLGKRFYFALPRRVGSTPTSRFGWNWFTPLISKYKKSLILVFVASLLAQLFGIAIPLMIQQIIDKVLAQGNLSSLNVLGSAMVILALFQGILTALRTYIFVDTTDRMDLTLGTAVIDRLLALPLDFFEKRPVGELSQRLGELNTIRGFLTGTALMSGLNLIFASLYLIVMIIYSPLLTAVALSILPIYFLLIFGISPIYKWLIRRRAVAQAKTQSHLVEILGGIQTVKAQHFELTARWKWQDRYKEYVNQGFRSTALGTASSVVGSFLTQLSGLLVLWVGMWLVLNGELTLGMLIAFRIISGNVTGPLLQLSTLYQGFQGVQISMERLSDIIDQNPELSNTDDLNQIPIPLIDGNIRFENVSFRFKDSGPNQVDDVNLEINSGNFVGIVGQSGSGKSTLMKLLPRLYKINHGRIFIDDYDISKVNLSSLRRQIGIVPQDSLLFEGTISENIALNDPQATTESIIEASKIACAHDFIMSLGQGYATKIAERGSNLSGGQRQRIAIARTILANPQLLIMDEATSALDYNTERQLCQNLQVWAENRTVLFITHRLSSIKDSDLIVVMHDGQLVEKGTHPQLISNCQRYAALYEQQGE
ncbi:ABC transporter transmembrane domain-containing protein [Synechococcus sp. CC9616]|uniref:ABC transporter transmembrane domain-containing protein n=1 Tax=Synechococcus sp. CC9616 TaxID=110663 RepID=UPI002100D02C|nr:ABC transporter transmembrane domain-containing protein [Synechococcus sp. CC9616]